MAVLVDLEEVTRLICGEMIECGRQANTKGHEALIGLRDKLYSNLVRIDTNSFEQLSCVVCEKMNETESEEMQTSLRGQLRGIQMVADFINTRLEIEE